MRSRRCLWVVSRAIGNRRWISGWGLAVGSVLIFLRRSTWSLTTFRCFPISTITAPKRIFRAWFFAIPA